MRRILYLMLGISSISIADTLPIEVIESIGELTDIYDESDVTLLNGTFSVKTSKNTVNRKYAIHIMQGTCEFLALEPEYWNGIDFAQIKVLNHSRNQGYKVDLTPKDCRYMINKDLSNSEIEQRFFKDGLKKF